MRRPSKNATRVVCSSSGRGDDAVEARAAPGRRARPGRSARRRARRPPTGRGRIRSQQASPASATQNASATSRTCAPARPAGPVSGENRHTAKVGSAARLISARPSVDPDVAAGHDLVARVVAVRDTDAVAVAAGPESTTSIRKDSGEDPCVRPKTLALDPEHVRLDDARRAARPAYRPVRRPRRRAIHASAALWTCALTRKLATSPFAATIEPVPITLQRSLESGHDPASSTRNRRVRPDPERRPHHRRHMP